mmetsp:Transcript_94888/g.273136  ORF Transcript_94888/g.273136 Transcript_94888/m.273136 type:complete len:244 (+) Transcript_94888:149-880(+)
MVLPIPLGINGDDAQAEVPAIVKSRYSILWWVLFGLLIGLCVMNVLAKDPFAVIFMGIMAVVVYYMVSNDCKGMSQYCIFLFGMMCTIEASFEIINLLMLVGGRTTHTRSVETVLSPDKASRTQKITIVENRHAFFDGSQDFVYNMQSAVKIVSPVAMLLGGLIAHLTYSAFSTSLFVNDGSEAGSLYGGDDVGGYGTSGVRLGGRSGPPQRGRSLGQAPGTVPFSGQGRPLFEGAGQRLGSD